jgi:hypothetical protein
MNDSMNDEGSLVSSQIAAGQRDVNKLTDAVFHRRHPELQGRRIEKGETALANEWLAIRDRVVTPRLSQHVSAPAAPTHTAASTPAASDADVAAARSIANRPVPNMAGVHVRDLIDTWRGQIAPEIPLDLLLAFIRYESGGNFHDATHGTAANNFTSPDFYELGLFQTPAGLHGTCTSGDSSSCENPPPGIEKPGEPSTWFRLCRKIGADPENWQDPETQARVGLLDLKTSADAIRSAYPDLFPTAGGDWYLRAAVLMPFARGGGFTRAFLNAFRNDLTGLSEDQRWGFLRGKTVPAHGGTWTFDTSNVDKKMSLAAALGAP